VHPNKVVVEISTLKIAALEQRANGGQTQFVELVVDRGLFFDINIVGWNASLRLTAIVIIYELFNSVTGKEAFDTA
jgi:hypothetical protein